MVRIPQQVTLGVLPGGEAEAGRPGAQVHPGLQTHEGDMVTWRYGDMVTLTPKWKMKHERVTYLLKKMQMIKIKRKMKII